MWCSSSNSTWTSTSSSRTISSWVTWASLLFKLLTILIGLSHCTFVQVIVASILLKMVRENCGLEGGVERVLVIGLISAMVASNYLGSITLVFITILAIFTKIAISLLSTVRINCH